MSQTIYMTARGVDNQNMENRMQALFYFSVAVLMAIILLWVGSRLLFSPSNLLSNGWLLLLGILLVLGGIFMVGANIADWQIVVAFILIGFYLCLRAAGIIEHAFLARIVGIVCVIEAVAGLYLTWPTRHRRESDSK
jgi:hypothetical protein